MKEKSVQHIQEMDVKANVGSGGPGHSLKHVIAPWTVGSEALWVGLTVIEQGVKTASSALEGIESVHVTLEGHGTEIVSGTEVETSPGSFVFIPKGAPHQVINRGEVPLKIVTIASPPVSKPRG